MITIEELRNKTKIEAEELRKKKLHLFFFLKKKKNYSKKKFLN